MTIATKPKVKPEPDLTDCRHLDGDTSLIREASDNLVGYYTCSRCGDHFVSARIVAPARRVVVLYGEVTRGAVTLAPSLMEAMNDLERVMPIGIPTTGRGE